MNAPSIPINRAALCADGHVFSLTDRVCPTCQSDSFSMLEKMLDRPKLPAPACSVCGEADVTLTRFAEGPVCDGCQGEASTVALVYLIRGRRYTKLISAKRVPLAMVRP